MNSGKYLIITLLSFTLPCVSNYFLLHRKKGWRFDVGFPPSRTLIGCKRLSGSQPIAAETLSRNPEEQHRLGYFHTLPQNLPATTDVGTDW